MKNYLLRNYNETKAKYSKFRTRLERRMKDGSFYQMSVKKQRQLINRVKKLFEKLKELQLALKLGTAGLTAAMALSFGTISAQEVQKDEPQKLFKKIEHKHKLPFSILKTSESVLFEQIRGENNPFGGKNPFDGLALEGGWPELADIDDDGDLDLMLGTYIENNDGGSYLVKLFRNIGNNEQVDLEELTGNDNPFSPLVFGNEPNLRLVDIDNDGDLDMFSTEAGDEYYSNYNWYQFYSVRYFKNTGTSSQAAFEEQTGANNPFLDVKPMQTQGFTFVDIDGDGDLDMFISDKEETQYITKNTLRFFKNTGTQTNPAFTEQFDANNPFDFLSDAEDFDWTPFIPNFADFDGDGDFDAVITEDEYARYFENIGSVSNPDFAERFDNNNPFDAPYMDEGFNAEFADFDSDGDLDALLLNNGGQILYYENTGSATNPVMTDENGVMGIYFASPEFADMDGDGDVDLILGTYGDFEDGDESILYFENKGTASSPAFENLDPENNPFYDLAAFYYSFPALVDIDNDGDFDMFNMVEKESVNDYDIAMSFFKNIGSKSNPIFEEQADINNPLNFLEFGEIAIADFVDIDGDGDFDCFLGTYDETNDQAIIKFYRNTGSANSPEFSEATNPLSGNFEYAYLLSPAFVDIDVDGDFDCVVGMYLESDSFEGGVLKYYKNTGTSTEPNFQEQTGIDNPFEDFPFSYYYFPSFADVDDDGDPDLLLGIYGGGTLYFRNNMETSSSNELDLEQFDAKIFPNPTNGIINIKLNNNSNLEANVEVYDNIGRKIETYTFDSKKFELDINHLQSGMYFVKIKQGNFVSTTKIIKE